MNANIYATNPLLQGVRTDYDLKMLEIYGNAALNKQYGPTPEGSRPAQPLSIKNAYMSLGNGYTFQGGSYMDYSKKPASYN